MILIDVVQSLDNKYMQIFTVVIVFVHVLVLALLVSELSKFLDTEMRSV